MLCKKNKPPYRTAFQRDTYLKVLAGLAKNGRTFNGFCNLWILSDKNWVFNFYLLSLTDFYDFVCFL